MVGARGSFHSPAERRSAEPSLASLARTPLAHSEALHCSRLTPFAGRAKLCRALARFAREDAARTFGGLPPVGRPPLAPRAVCCARLAGLESTDGYCSSRPFLASTPGRFEPERDGRLTARASSLPLVAPPARSFRGLPAVGRAARGFAVCSRRPEVAVRTVRGTEGPSLLARVEALRLARLESAGRDRSSRPLVARRLGQIRTGARRARSRAFAARAWQGSNLPGGRSLLAYARRDSPGQIRTAVMGSLPATAAQSPVQRPI